MSELDLMTALALPAGLGLLGFVEPCSIGSSLVFIKFLEGKEGSRKLAEVGAFTAVRALFMGTLGVAAALLGSAFLGLQASAWIALGALYVLIGALYLGGRARVLMVSIGPSLSRLSGLRGSASLGILFGLNIPACAAPLLFTLLGTAAASSATGGTFARGFVSLALFGLFLSLPLVVLTLFERTRRVLDALAALSGRFPFWAGTILVVLGLWSIGFALLQSPT